MNCLNAKFLLLLLLLQCGDIELNPGPRKSVSKAPTADDKINGLASTLSDYEAKIQGLETELETIKDSNDKKLQTLETQLGELTSQIAKLKSDGNAEMQTSLNEIKSDLGERLVAAESNLNDVKAAFESFRQESTNQSQKSLKKLEEVSGQIKAFQDMNQGTVSGVLHDNEFLKANYGSVEQKLKELRIEATGKIQSVTNATREQRREYKAKFVDMDVEFGRLKERMETLNMILDDMQEKMYEFEQNKKNNLILYGILTKHPETSDSLKARVINIFKDHLNIRRDITVVRAARIHTGPEVRGTRPVLVTFENFKDRETVLRLAKTLKKANIHVTEDLSRRTRECRAELRKFLRQIKKINPEKNCFLEYDKLYVDNKIYEWNEVLGQVVEHTENQRYGGDMLFSRPGTQLGGIFGGSGPFGGQGYGNSRPPSGMSMRPNENVHPKSASAIPRLPPLTRAVSLSAGIAQLYDPRDEKLNEMERMIQSYQEKLDSVTTNYQEKVNILERRLVDREIDAPFKSAPGSARYLGPAEAEMSDVDVDRDEDSPQPQHNTLNNVGSPVKHYQHHNMEEQDHQDPKYIHHSNLSSPSKKIQSIPEEDPNISLEYNNEEDDEEEMDDQR